jgi:hypothetical protein
MILGHKMSNSGQARPSQKCIRKTAANPAKLQEMISAKAPPIRAVVQEEASHE